MKKDNWAGVVATHECPGRRDGARTAALPILMFLHDADPGAGGESQQR
jgi:hypothetical protein